LKIQGRDIRRIAFIHCVGSRQIPGIHEPAPGANLNEYCSRTCCSAILRAAVEIRRNHPDTHVLDYYRDIRTYGRGQEAYYDRAAEHNVLFFRFEPDAPPVIERGNGKYPLRVRVKDTLTFGEELTAEVDLVVLAVGMEAQPIGDLVEMMKLPTGMDGFLQEVHPKLRPVEVANNGILLAGTCQAPFDVSEACAAAQAAAVKTATLLAKGYVELDPYVAEVDPERCTGNGLVPGRLPGDRRHPNRPGGGWTGHGQPGPLHRLRDLCGRMPRTRHRYQGLDPQTIRRHGGCHRGGLAAAGDKR
jgi:heterodisulfide reductase subunit A